MNLLRRIPTSRLVLLLTAVVLLVGAGSAIAVAALSGEGEKPPPKPLAEAVHDALTAPEVQGVTARVSFENNLIDAGSFEGRDPVLTGADGRLWASDDGRLRLELQSDAGDAQLVVNQDRFFAYDASSNTVYQGQLPEEPEGKGKGKAHDERVPSLERIQRALTRIAKHANLSGAEPSNVAGRPAYTVRVSPRHDGGLVGAAELAWDAVRGAPLRAAVYAQGQQDPVLELEATEVAFGPVPASAFDVKPPAGAKVVNVERPSKDELEKAHGKAEKGKHEKPISGVDQVQQRLSFELKAPETLAGLPREEVLLLDHEGGEAGAVVTYGKGLGGIAVVQVKPDPKHEAKAKADEDDEDGGEDGRELELPEVSIDGATGSELATPLGTVVRFERDGVQYVVIGSVPPAAAESAARELF